MSAPPPLVPANVDLRSMPEMPLDVRTLRDASVTVSITDSAFKAAVLLWSAAWHQIPASSLPDDDKMLAFYAGRGTDISGWLEIREQALWKFVKCSDGRLYHPVIAQKAIRVWEYRENYRIRMETARLAKASKKSNPTNGNHSSMTVSVTDIMTGPVSGLNQTKQNGSLGRRTSLAAAPTPNYSRAPTMLGAEAIASLGLRGSK